MTIRKKLALLFSGLLALFIVVSGLITFGVIRATWLETIDSTLRETAEQVLTNSRAFIIREFGSPTRIGVRLPQLDIFRASGVLVQAWALDGDKGPRLASASENLGSYRDPLDKRMLGFEAASFSVVQINNTPLRVLTSPIRVPGQETPLMSVQVAASLETLNEAMEKLAILMLAGGGLAVVGAFGLGMWLSNQALRPIERIIQAADSISTAQDLRIRLPWNGPQDELGRLTSVFNRMMDRLEHLFGVQQRFVADVSHELRTPLTTIRGNLDLARRYGMDAASLEAIESETERMSRMVNDLLVLARADAGALTLELSPLDLDTVVADVFRQARVLVRDRDLTLKLDHLEPVRVNGNSDRMRQLLLNLVNNAIQFTPDKGQISLGLRRVDDQAVLTVADTGVGISPEDLPYIFDRFYQAERSRARAEGQGGAGLGLAIVRWIAQAHGASVDVQSTLGVGSTFTVRLPVLTDPESHSRRANGDLNHANGMNGYPALRRLGLPLRRRAPAEMTTPEA